MGRKSRSKHTATVRLAPQSSSSDRRLQGHNKAVEGSKKLTVSSIVYPIVVTILVGIVGVVAQRWLTEIGEHEKTRGELSRERESKGTVTTERNQLKEAVADLRTKNARFEQLHPILKFYGPRAKVIASYDLKKEAGSPFAIGSCPEAPGFRIRLLGIRQSGNVETADLALGGIWEGMIARSDNAFGISLPLRRRCSKTVARQSRPVYTI